MFQTDRTSSKSHSCCSLPTAVLAAAGSVTMNVVFAVVVAAAVAPGSCFCLVLPSSVHRNPETSHAATDGDGVAVVVAIASALFVLANPNNSTSMIDVDIVVAVT